MKKLNKIVLITIMMLLLLLIGSINVLGEGLLEDGKFLDENSLYVCETKEDGTIAIKGVTNKFDTKYKNAEELKIPDTINGKEVTSVFLRLNRISTLKKIELPKGMKLLASYVFEGCENLEEVIMPDNLSAIGQKAFFNCTKLKKIEIPNVTSLDNCVFENCSSLTSIELQNATIIGEFCFDRCSSLTSIEIPNVTTVEDYAFKECSSLKSIKLPAINGSFGIRPGTFEGCTNLETVTLSEGIAGIGANVFKNCTNLKEINIPKSVTFINAGAFEGCTNLQNITIKNRIVKINEDSISNVNGLTIYGYAGSTAQTYANANGIKFEELPPETSNVEKAGILMAAFGRECVDAYSNKFYYNIDRPNGAKYVFNNPYGEMTNSSLTLDCVGNLNLFIYQSTGLWANVFTEGNDNTYLTPQSGLYADDLFEYVGTVGEGQLSAFNNIANAINSGKLVKGDLIRLDRHVAIYSGLDDSGKILCPENYNAHRSLTYKNFVNGSPSVWGVKGQIYRIKEEAANRIKVLDYLDTKEEIEEYAKKVAEAYMKGTAEYKGLTLKRKTYNDTRITINPETTLEPQIDYGILNGTTIKPKVNSEVINGQKITYLDGYEGWLVKDIKNLDEFKEYDRIEVIDVNGNVIENENTKMTRKTGIEIRCYKNISAGSAIDVRAGGANQGEKLVDIIITVVYGDTTGDGIVNAVDALAIVKNKTGKVLFKGPAYAIAGRVSESSRQDKKEATAVDALMIIQARLGKIKIIQGDIEREIDIETEEDDGIIPIYTREDLAEVGSGDEWLVAKANKIYKMDTDRKYKLMNDIDLSEKPWTPIGRAEVIDEETGEVKSTILTNQFDGSNYKIKGMTITGEQTTKDLGLFSVCSAVIENLTLENVNISDITYSEDAKSIVDYTNNIRNGSNGAIVGVILADKVEESNTIILNECTTTGEIDINNAAFSGIVGAMYSINNDKTLEIANCTNNINIKSNWASSGIVMYSNTDINIINCTNNGITCGAGIMHITEADTTLYNVINNGETRYAGIVAAVQGGNISIYNSINNGKVTSGSGIIQVISHSNEYKTNVTIQNCVNKGEILSQGQSQVAGICGQMISVEKLKIINTINEGNVWGANHVGGILGFIQEAPIIEIENCKNTGNITCILNGGGIAGQIYDVGKVTISNCTNSKEGVITGESDLGGIIGWIDDCYSSNVIEKCVNQAEVIGKITNIGGIIGRATSNIEVIECKNEGKLTGGVEVGDIIGSER